MLDIALCFGHLTDFEGEKPKLAKSHMEKLSTTTHDLIYVLIKLNKKFFFFLYLF